MMEKNILEEVKKFVEEESLKNNLGWHKEWMVHLNAVEENSAELAEKLNADKEVAALSAWLHDIGTIVKGVKKDHHIIGAEIAENKLRELGYPEVKIKEVKHCVFSHRASQKIPRETVEAQILADADSMAHFEKIEDLVKAEMVLGGLDQKESEKEIQEKLKRDIIRLSPVGKEFAKEKYPEIFSAILK